MTNLMPFTYESTELRTFNIDGEPWFVAADVARLLEYRDAHNMARRLDDDDRGTRSVSTPSGTQQMTVISEAGFYAAILGSQCAGAKAIKRWLTHDVLPAIRKTGSYSIAELSRREILTMALEAEERADAEHAARIEAERHARALEAPASAWSHLAESTGDYAVADAAKVLSRDPSIMIGRDRLFKFMQMEGWIYRDRATSSWKARQTQVDTGRLVEKLGKPFLHENTGEMRMPAPTIRITTKGLAELHKRLGGDGQMSLLAVS
ncbi:BRO family protein [Nocardia asteroides]|uniref:BRO family protein n=1 Tax=Nocardia asteroides TaxID=1824 RepID=UPI0033F3D8AE